jgi:regulator of sigma E protease
VLLALGILVFVHELGHFLTAKFFDMQVDRFSIGFPPTIFSKKWGETEYVIGATPLGGYVKIAGMIDESLDTDDMDSEPAPRDFRAKPVWQRIIVITAGVVMNMILAAIIFMGLKTAYGEQYIPAENVEAVHVEEGSVASEIGLRTGDRIVAVSGEKLERFSDLGDLDRLLADSLTITVERAGSLRTLDGPRNIMTKLSRAGRQEGVLGSFGISYEPAVVGGIVEDSPADSAGLQRGDRIVAVGGDSFRFWAELTEHVESSGGQPLTVRWHRPDSLADASVDSVAAEQRALPAPAQFGNGGGRTFARSIRPEKQQGRYVLGIYPVRAAPELFEAEFGPRRAKYGAGEALTAGLNQTWSMTSNIVVILKRIVTGRESFRESVGGPVMIAEATKEAADRGARPFWSLVAMLSITLAIMNILPVPALDGGHLVFLIYEGIARREPSVRVRMALQQIGMVLLLAFMAFVIFNDILRL